MAAVYEIQGYTVVLDKIVHITRVFDAGNEGVQFNIRLLGDVRLALKYPDLGEGTLARELLVEALKKA